MTVKQYLSRAFWLNNKINNKLRTLEQLKNQSEKGTSSFIARNKSGTSSRSHMECMTIEIIDLKYALNALIDELVDLKAVLKQEIEHLSEDMYRYILIQRYIEFWSWEDIAHSINLSFIEVIHYHGYALKKFEQLMATGGGASDQKRIVPTVLS